MAPKIFFFFFYLLLQFEGNTSDWPLLDSLHEMRGEASDLVTDSLGGGHRDIGKDPFVNVEVIGQF